MKFKTLFLLSLTTWLLLVSVSFFWNYKSASQEQERVALESARTLFEFVIITRAWNAQHAGVYAPLTASTQPNPFLDPTLREIEVNENLTLTRINPAYMTRQLSEIARERGHIEFHMTSLKLVNPNNKPNPIEEQALHDFEKGVKETGIILEKDGEQKFFYMAPLMTDKSCLACHAKEGYKEGDIRGGVSITLPYLEHFPVIPLLLWHLLIAGAGFIAFYISYRKLSRAYNIIERQAQFDALTDIPNRGSFSDTLEIEFKRHQRSELPLSMIMCDIDKFKYFNDTYGHVAGDDCLRNIAKTIEKALKRPSDFCARYGGEEFAVILPNTNLEGALHFAESLREEVESQAMPNENALPLQIVTISLGVACIDNANHLPSAEILIKQADEALYQAKKNGRNQVQSYQK